MDNAFSKARRLTRSVEFDRVRKEGSKIRGLLISIGVLQLGTPEKFRAGFITSRKVGSAVVRNRVRRRLREIVRRHQSRVKKGTWIVVIGSPQAAKGTYRELEVEYLRLAERASILAA